MSLIDSPEELWASWWLDEVFEAGYIASFQHHPEPFLLSPAFSYKYDKHLKTRTKELESNLLSPHIYSPDYKISWHKNARGIFWNAISDRVQLKNIPFVAQETEDGNNNYYSIVEIKAGFSKFHAGREFSINQKWMLQRFGVYVNKTIISNKTGLFKDTFCPGKYLLTDKAKKNRTLHFEPRTLEEFINQRAV